MRRAACPGAVAVVAFVGLSVSTAPAMALPSMPQPDHAHLIKPIKRCPPGYRKSTVTAKCVRKQPRWPILSWSS